MTQKGVALPPALAEVLQKDGGAIAAFEALRPSCQQRYANWVEGAKRAETRERRVGRVVEMALDWKRRHDRHQHRGSLALADNSPK